MEKLFHPENPVIIFLGRVCDLMLLISSPSGDIPAFLSYVFVLFSIAAVLLTAWLSWLFPLQARFENSFRRHSKNGAILALSNLPATCLLTLTNLLPVISFLIFPGSLGGLTAFWVIFGFGAVAYTMNFSDLP